MDPRDPNELFRDVTVGAVPTLEGAIAQVGAFPGRVRLILRTGELAEWGLVLVQVDLDPFLAEQLGGILYNAAERAE